MIKYFLSGALSFLVFLFGGSSVAQASACTAAPVVLNLQSNGLKKGDCFKKDVEDVDQCIWDEIKDDLEKCQTEDNFPGVDIYVPGTNSEDGDYKQFTSLHDMHADGRLTISLKYQAGHWVNAISYKDGVGDASNALRNLLQSIKIKSDLTDVRVFGHSKGSHAVAVVSMSENDNHNYAKFFAIGQPGRTDEKMGDNIPAAPLGTPGYIHKLSDNLIGITWQNDEVHHYDGGLGGAPESWQIPGLANPGWLTGVQKPGGTLSTRYRIDHHEMYGGDYIEKSYPHCVAGSRFSWSRDENCKEKDVAYKPYFWGNQSCHDAAMEMMAMPEQTTDNSKRFIGNSEPRDACVFEDGNTPNKIFIKEAVVRYKYNIPDKHCKVNAVFEFLPGGANIGWEIASPRLSVTELNHMYSFTTKIKRNFEVPNYMRLKVRTHVTRKEDSNRPCKFAAPVQIKIEYLKLTFDHPGTGEEKTQYIIRGKYEGDGLVGKITGQNNVAWQRKDLKHKHDDMDMFNTAGTIKISSAAVAGKRGVFYKDLHLID